MKNNDNFKKPLVTPPPVPGNVMEPNAPIIPDPSMVPPVPQNEPLKSRDDLMKKEEPFKTRDLLSSDEKKDLESHLSDNKKAENKREDDKLSNNYDNKEMHKNDNDKKHQKEDENMRGELTYDDKVIQKIVGVALGEVKGLLSIDGGFFSNLKEKLVNTDDVTAGIETEVGKKQVAVDMDVVVEYGHDIEAIFEQIKEVIAREVEHMTHLEVIEVNVNVSDIKTKEQHEEDSETVQDKLSDTWEDTKDFASKQSDKAKKAFDKGKDKVEDKVDEAREPRVE